MCANDLTRARFLFAAACDGYRRLVCAQDARRAGFLSARLRLVRFFVLLHRNGSSRSDAPLRRRYQAWAVYSLHAYLAFCIVRVVLESLRIHSSD
jgi:hypothetical protein